VYGEAEKCLTTLSTRLGDQEFFFGSHPTSLDATVYAYLAPLLKVPFPSPALQNYLKACPNLARFVVRITQRYFPYAIQGMYYLPKNELLLHITYTFNVRSGVVV
jgi:metaxin